MPDLLGRLLSLAVISKSVLQVPGVNVIKRLFLSPNAIRQVKFVCYLCLVLQIGLILARKARVESTLLCHNRMASFWNYPYIINPVHAPSRDLAWFKELISNYSLFDKLEKHWEIKESVPSWIVCTLQCRHHRCLHRCCLRCQKCSPLSHYRWTADRRWRRADWTWK